MGRQIEDGGRPGEKGQEAGEERACREQFCNTSLYFVVEMGQSGESHYGEGREAGVNGTGSGS